jgi:hypothetical protein
MNGNFLWEMDRAREEERERTYEWNLKEHEYDIEAMKEYARKNIRMNEIEYDGWGTWSRDSRDSYNNTSRGRIYANGMTDEDLERKAREVREAEYEMEQMRRAREEKLRAEAAEQRMIEEERLRREEEARKPFIEKKANNRKIFVLKDGVE